MTWSQRFRARESIRGSLWVLPMLGAILGALLAAFVSFVDEQVGVPTVWSYSPSTASSVLTSIVGATAALTGFVVTVTVLVVQMAIGTFSARSMRLWYRDGLLKATLAVLVGTLTFSFSLLRRIESNFVPDIGVTLSGVLVTLSLLLFLLFFNRFVHRLRPVAVAAYVGEAGRAAFAQNAGLAERPDIRWQRQPTTDEPTLLVRASRAGSIQAVHSDGLVRWARDYDAELVLTHAVGDFVPAGGTLFQVYGGGRGLEGAERELQGMVALGDERTIQQDPAFALRIMADIAVKALSAAINDPTTAVQALDHLGELLRHIGSTDFRKRSESPGQGTEARVVMRARSWEDFLTLGVTEIRLYGLSAIQVMRRLRAVLEELRETVRPEHRDAVVEELRRLDAMVEEIWRDSIDLDRARVADTQGIGGPAASRRGS
jgi:uncharacterized membrane protein